MVEDNKTPVYFTEKAVLDCDVPGLEHLNFLKPTWGYLSTTFKTIGASLFLQHATHCLSGLQSEGGTFGDNELFVLLPSSLQPPVLHLAVAVARSLRI